MTQRGKKKFECTTDYGDNCHNCARSIIVHAQYSLAFVDEEACVFS